MNKTARKPAKAGSKTSRKKSARGSNGVLTGTSAWDQRRRYNALRKHLAERLAKAERMTSQERAKADAEWELFKNTMNEERRRVGARLLYLD